MKVKEIIRFVYDQLKVFKFRIFFILISIIFITIIGVITPLYGEKLFDEGIMNQNIQKIAYYIMVIFGLFLLEQIIQFIQFIQYEYINRVVPYNLLKKAFKHSLDLKISYYKDNSFYEIINNTFADINHISRVTNSDIIQSVVSLFKIIGGIIGLAIINWRMMLFTISIIPISLTVSHLFSNIQRKYFKRLLSANAEFNLWFNETLNGVELVKLWNLKKRKYADFEEKQNKVIKQNSKIEYLNNASTIAGSIISFLMNYGLIFLGAVFIMQEKLTIGGLYAFISYSSLVIQPMEIIAGVIGRLSSSVPSFERYINYFKNEIEDIDNKDKIKVESVIPVKKICFDKVDFSYAAEKQILQKMSFTVNRGEKVAFIGLNGSGKSSILNLLLRLYEPDAGRILFNDINIKDLELESYRDIYSVMNQRVYLLNDSIKNNIDIYHDLTDTEINELVKIVTLTDYLGTLPEGIDSTVGYNGTKLSGGEKQKIALARSLGKKSKILILDEATANFDIKAEYLFNEYIYNTVHYDFIFIVTHRLDILKKVERIFVIENGVIIEEGSYKELLAKGIEIEKLLLKEEEENECSN